MKRHFRARLWRLLEILLGVVGVIVFLTYQFFFWYAFIDGFDYYFDLEGSVFGFFLLAALLVVFVIFIFPILILGPFGIIFVAFIGAYKVWEWAWGWLRFSYFPGWCWWRRSAFIWCIC